MWIRHGNNVPPRRLVLTDVRLSTRAEEKSSRDLGVINKKKNHDRFQGNIMPPGTAYSIEKKRGKV